MSFAVLQSAFGLAVFVFIAWLLSENRRAVSVRLVIIGLALQLALAVMLLKLPMFRDVFLVLNRAMEILEAGTRAGTSFVFGYLGGGALSFEEPYSGVAYVFAFRGLPVIVLTAALSSLLYHWKIIPVLARGENPLHLSGEIASARSFPALALCFERRAPWCCAATPRGSTPRKWAGSWPISTTGFWSVWRNWSWRTGGASLSNFR